MLIAEKGDFSVSEQAVEKVKSFANEQRRATQDCQRRKPIFSCCNASTKQLLQLVRGYLTIHSRRFQRSLARKYFAIGIAQKGLRDDAAARTAFLKAKGILEQQVKQKPDDADLHVQLGKLLAWLGEKDAAIAEAQRAMDLRPESKDAFEGPRDH